MYQYITLFLLLLYMFFNDKYTYKNMTFKKITYILFTFYLHFIVVMSINSYIFVSAKRE